jgi:Family of unknown function (DUF6155)
VVFLQQPDLALQTKRNTMGLIEVKKEINKMDRDQLFRLICDLYSNQKKVKEYLDFFVNPNEEELFEKYKEKIRLAFFPKRGYNASLADSRKAINDFKKISKGSDFLGDLMIYHVEMGEEYINTYGGIQDSFYGSTEKLVVDAIAIFKANNSTEKYADRLDKLKNHY